MLNSTANCTENPTAVGVASGQSVCATARRKLPNPNTKLDYWFSDASMRATPVTSIINIGTSTVSDHYPVEATFQAK